MIPQSVHTLTAASVAGVFFLVSCFALTIRLGTFRRMPLGLTVVLGLFVGPIAALLLSAMAIKDPPLEVKASGGGFFKSGADGVLSVAGIAVAGLNLLLFLGTTYYVARYELDMHGEPLQQPLTIAIVIGGLVSGVIVSRFARRVAFIEALFLTALVAAGPAVLGGMIKDLFTYGTAPAYFAVVLVAAFFLLALCIVLGGSLGFLFFGDGELALSWSYENWIARRFLVGKRGQGVVGIISVISVLAVAVGTCAMIVVMSVMNGFSTDLRTKIFGANAHLIVLKYGTDFTEYDKIREKTRDVQGVTGASPFVLNEVMVSSDVNLTGALLKGIDVDTIDDVSVLRTNVTRGDLNFLKTPGAIPKGGTKAAPADASSTGAKKIGDAVVSPPAGDAPAAPGAVQQNPTDPPPPPAGEAPPPPPDGEGMPDQATLDAALLAAAAGTPAGDAVAEKDGAMPGIAIGKEMSRNLKVFVGDVINVVSPVGELGPTGPVPKARAFRVAAIFYSGMYEYDSKFIYIDLEEAQDFFGLKGAATGLEYRIDDIEAVQGISRDILDRIGGYPYRTKDWMEMNRNLFSALKLEKIAMFIILTFIILVASFLITATLIVFVIEKSKEIAILKSMGATDTSIMKVFVTYGVIVGSLGAICGLVAGVALCVLIQTFGIGLDPDVYYIENLPVHVEPVEVVLVAVAAICLSYLATIYPALLAARLRPVEGLRFE